MTFIYPTAFTSWDRAETHAILRVFGSKHFTMGLETDEFEESFARYHSRRFAIAVNSGSSANLIAVSALSHHPTRPLLRGDRAVVPGFAWATTYSPLIQHGLDLTLADCGDTWNTEWDFYDFTDPSSFELIVGVPILGNPTSLPEIDEGGKRPWTLMDCCESIGSFIGENKTGYGADIATYSGYFSHQLSAIELGVITTDDDELAKLCRLLRNHGWSRHVHKPVTFEDEAEFVLAGYNVRPVELHCAIAREQLKKLDAGRVARTLNFLHFQDLMGDRVTFPRWNGTPNPFGIHMMLESQDVRTKVAKALRSEGIDCRIPAGGSFRLQPYSCGLVDGQATPEADKIHRRGIMIGNAPFGIPQLVEKAARVVKDLLG